jgi:DNA-binding CsgD family transcriptional regulator
VAEPRGVEGLLAVADSMTRAIRTGAYQTDPEEGILLDVTIGRVRCLLVEQQETVTVSLSPREQQVAVMVAAGRTNQAIAGSLEISAWTVSTHLRRIYAKLAVSSRAEMVAHLLGRAEYASLVDASPDHRPR